jgi:thiol-disulfide isomerase/thioredoxin
MKTTLFTLTVIATVYGFSLAAAKDKTPVADHQIGEFKIGAHITGPEVSAADLNGKAVLIDAWGIHCGPCLASLPDIEKIAKRYKDKMVVIGAHSQNATDDEVRDVVKKNRLSYTITKGVNGPVNFNAIPHVFVFDTAGKMLFEGHPADKEFDKAIRKSVAGASTTSAPSALDSLKPASGTATTTR